MDVTFGSVAAAAPEGFLSRRVHFSTMVRLNEETLEGIMSRTIQGDGFSTRELPRPIDGMGPGRGHFDTVPIGRVDQLTISDNNVEGWGWLANTDAGRQAYQELDLQISNGTSITMADVKYDVDIVWPDDFEGLPEVKMVFTKANLDTATLVLGPAFGSAKAVLEEDLTASLAIAGDLEVRGPWTIEIPESGPRNVTAAAGVVLPHEALTVPEPDVYTTWNVSRDGKFVSGHLGRWGDCHTGFIDRCVQIPRSRTNYASYCKKKFPTDKGSAYTGPVILLGGHKATLEQINEALADPKHAFADVTVVDGKIGPWMCGVVRPGVTDEALHAAYGSGVSGHWVRGELYAICAVSAEGFDVPRATKFVVETDEDNEVVYLAASFAPGCDCEDEESADETFDAEETLALARLALEDDNADTRQEVSA